MIQIAIAPNSFRNSISTFDAVAAIRQGFAKALPDAQFVELPIADGGEFTAAVLQHYLGGETRQARATGPLGKPLNAGWGLLGGGETAIVEVSAASGIGLLRRKQLDPLKATSYGTGELIRAALQQGCRQILVALGGSATVDGGAGLLEALGVRLLAADGTLIGRGGGGLSALGHIDMSRVDPAALAAKFEVICDVDNPLVGPQGAAIVFGPQKGATPETCQLLDANLAHFAEILRRDLDRDVAKTRHGGAAGGISAGLHGVFGAKLVQGIDLILERIGFAGRIAGCDLLVTAEGRLDRQTLNGKAPYGVARVAHERKIPVIALCGQVKDAAEVEASGMFDAILPLPDRLMSLDEAIRQTARLLADASERAAELIALGGTLKL